MKTGLCRSLLCPILLLLSSGLAAQNVVTLNLSSQPSPDLHFTLVHQKAANWPAGSNAQVFSFHCKNVSGKKKKVDFDLVAYTVCGNEVTEHFSFKIEPNEQLGGMGDFMNSDYAAGVTPGECKGEKISYVSNGKTMQGINRIKSLGIRNLKIDVYEGKSALRASDITTGNDPVPTPVNNNGSTTNASKTNSNSSNISKPSSGYTPQPLNAGQQYAKWLNDFNNNLIREQQVAQQEYMMAQQAVQDAFSGNTSTKQGLQNLQQSLGDLAQSQDMSTSAGRTRAIGYGVQSLAAGIGSLLIKERDYEAEARAREERDAARRAASERSSKEKEKATAVIENFLSGDMVWLLANDLEPAGKIEVLNSINTRNIRMDEIGKESIYNYITAGYGADTAINFSTGMETTPLKRFRPLQPGLSSAFDLTTNTYYLFDKKMHRKVLKGKYGNTDQFYYRGLTAMFFDDPGFKIRKNRKDALSSFEKVMDANSNWAFSLGALDAMGEIYYDSAISSGDTRLLQQAFGLFSKAFNHYSGSNQNNYSKNSLPGKMIYHNLLLTCHQLVKKDDLSREDKEKYVNSCMSIFQRMYRPGYNVIANIDKQAKRFMNEKDHYRALKLFGVMTDTNYIPRHSQWVRANGYIGIGDCYANGWGLAKDTGLALMNYHKALEVFPSYQESITDVIEKIRHPEAWAEKHALNHLYHRRLPAQIGQLLDSVALEQPICNVQLTESGGFIVQLGNASAHRWLYKDIPGELREAIMKANNPEHPIRQVYLSPDKKTWAVIYGKNFYNTNGLPPDLLKKMREYYDRGDDIKSIALSPQGWWVVLTGRNGYSWNRLPMNMINKLKELNEQRSSIDHVVFHPKSGWLIISDDNGYWYDGIASEIVQKLKEYNSKKRTIRYVVFDNKNGFLIN